MLNIQEQMAQKINKTYAFNAGRLEILSLPTSSIQAVSFYQDYVERVVNSRVRQLFDEIPLIVANIGTLEYSRDMKPIHELTRTLENRPLGIELGEKQEPAIGIGGIQLDRKTIDRALKEAKRHLTSLMAEEVPDHIKWTDPPAPEEL